MTDNEARRRLVVGFGDVERFLVKSYERIAGAREFDIEKYGPCVDAVRSILAPSLEKQIIFCLERFVYNGNPEQSASVQATVKKALDFLENALLTNGRLMKLVKKLESDGVKMRGNFLGCENAVSRTSERNFWIPSSSSPSGSSGRSSAGSPLGGRPRKRAATHADGRLRRPEGPEGFGVSKSCGWAKGNRCKRRRREWRRKRERKNGNLALLIRKTSGNEPEDRRNRGNCGVVGTSLPLPCRADQLMSKLEKADSSLANSNRASSIGKKFRSKLENVCSCLNDLLRKINRRNIDSVRLFCDVRSDYLHLKLKRTAPSRSGSSLFTGRVSTCEALRRCGAARRKEGGSRGRRWDRGGEKTEARLGDPDGRADCDGDEVVSSIEISLTGAEAGRIAARGSGTRDPVEAFEALALARDSPSIGDVVERLELPPFRLEETGRSLRTRCEIRDLIRSMIVCTSGDADERRSISVQATISASRGTKTNAESSPVESKPPTTIESGTFARKTGPGRGCGRPGEEVGKRDEPGGSERDEICRDKSVEHPEPPSSEESANCKLNEMIEKTEAKICETWTGISSRGGQPTGPRGPPSSDEILRSATAAESSDAPAADRANDDDDDDDDEDYDIDVTVEIEESSDDDGSGSISRHAHTLPSMKTVKLGTRGKSFSHDFENSASSSSSSSSSSSKSGGEMATVRISRRGEMPGESYERMKRLIVEKVRRKLQSETESRAAESSKTFLSGGKYYLSIPSSKSGSLRVRERSGSVDDLRLPEPSSGSSLDDGTVASGEPFGRGGDRASPGSSAPSSKAANFDRNSIYGCTEDRLANLYLADIVDDYADEGGEGDSSAWDDCDGISFGRSVASASDVTESSTDPRSSRDGEKPAANRLAARNSAKMTSEIRYLGKFDEIGWTTRPRVGGWSTRAIGPSSSTASRCQPLAKSAKNRGSRVGDRGDVSPDDERAGSIGAIERYKKRLRTIDRNLRTKLLRCVDLCKSLRSKFQRRICLDRVREAGGTSVNSNYSYLERWRYSDIYFGG